MGKGTGDTRRSPWRDFFNKETVSTRNAGVTPTPVKTVNSRSELRKIARIGQQEKKAEQKLRKKEAKRFTKGI